MQEIRITRKSKLGFGYSTTPDNTKGYPAIQPVESPQHTGTIKQILNEIDDDTNYQSLKSVFMTTAWYLRLNGGWVEIKHYQPNHPADLLLTNLDGEFVHDYLMITTI
ncbi:MAG: hypothetical protein ACTSQ8_26850 [Candidatus Helarchaeota archaeon]